MASGHSRVGVGMRANWRISRLWLLFLGARITLPAAWRVAAQPMSRFQKMIQKQIYRPNQTDCVPGLCVRQGTRLYKGGKVPVAGQHNRAGWGTWPCLPALEVYLAGQTKARLSWWGVLSQFKPILAGQLCGDWVGDGGCLNLKDGRDAGTGLREDSGWTLVIILLLWVSFVWTQFGTKLQNTGSSPFWDDHLLSFSYYLRWKWNPSWLQGHLTHSPYPTHDHFHGFVGQVTGVKSSEPAWHMVKVMGSNRTFCLGLVTSGFPQVSQTPHLVGGSFDNRCCLEEAETVCLISSNWRREGSGREPGSGQAELSTRLV